LADWKYIRPADLTTPYVDNRGKSWKFCTHCRCRDNQRVRIYQLSHLDSEHCSPDPGPLPPTPALLAAATVLLTAPSWNHSQVTSPSFIPFGPPEVAFPLDFVDYDDPDAIEFQGVWCIPVEGAFNDACVSVCAVPLEREESVKYPDSPLTTVSGVPAPSLWFECELWVDCDDDEPQSEPEPFCFDAVATLDVTATTVRPLLSCAPVCSFLVHWWFLFCLLAHCHFLGHADIFCHCAFPTTSSLLLHTQFSFSYVDWISRYLANSERGDDSRVVLSRLPSQFSDIAYLPGIFLRLSGRDYHILSHL
jgi:hypothetical protein